MNVGSTAQLGDPFFPTDNLAAFGQRLRPKVQSKKRYPARLGEEWLGLFRSLGAKIGMRAQ